MNESEFIRVLRRNKVFDTIFDRLPDLELPDAWVASGAIFQTYWNHLTNREPEHGIKDYDVLYFDSKDLSWDGEDRVIKACDNLFKDVKADIEIRNQARVPLWFQEKFGMPYAPIKGSREAINRFLATVCVIGIQPRKDEIRVYAPFGFVDLENMYIRPNLSCAFNPDNYLSKAQRWQERWPEVQMEEGGSKAYLAHVTYGDDT